ncbi:DNA-helicase UvrD [Sesbania bispinosa]|nr:DNA-helicase UvrD [Sesbania bispinosa]
MEDKVKKLDQSCTKTHRLENHPKIKNKVSGHKNKVSSIKKTWLKLRSKSEKQNQEA